MVYNLRCQTFLSLLLQITMVEAEKVATCILMPIGVNRALACAVW